MGVKFRRQIDYGHAVTGQGCPVLHTSLTVCQYHRDWP